MSPTVKLRPKSVQQLDKSEAFFYDSSSDQVDVLLINYLQDQLPRIVLNQPVDHTTILDKLKPLFKSDTGRRVFFIHFEGNFLRYKRNI